MAEVDKLVRTRYTVLHVREEWLDVEHAVSLLDPSYTGYDLTSTGKLGWTTLALTERDAEILAPALAGTLDKPVYVIHVEAEHCAVAIARPDQQLVPQQFDGLDDPAVSGTEKHRKALQALDIPPACADRPHPTSGVLVLRAPLANVRTKLPDADHGAWLLPVEGHADRCAVVSDGTGWEPDAEAIQAGLADHADLSMVVVTWWDQHAEGGPGGYLEVVTTTDGYEVDLGTRPDEAEVDPDEAKELAGLAKAFAELVQLDDAGSDDVLAAIEESRTDLTGGCVRLLALAGVSDVPPGATATELAVWAADREGAVRLTDGTGVAQPSLRRTVAEARELYLRRARLRLASRVFTWIGVIAFLAGVAVLLWGPPVWTTAAFAVLVLVVAGRAAVRRLIGPKGSA